MRDEHMATYVLDMRFEFGNHPPTRYNPAAPEVAPTQSLCADTVRDILERSGFVLLRSSHGCRRTDEDPELAPVIPIRRNP